MNNLQKSLGKKGEEEAVALLKRSGYRILERNFRCRAGEIDVIACDGDTLCFVEVKTRRSSEYGSPDLSVTPTKMRRIAAAAQFYLVQKGAQDADCRFDVVAILADAPPPNIELYKGAFTPERPLP